MRKTPVQMSNSNIKWSHMKQKLTPPEICGQIESGQFCQLSWIEMSKDDTGCFQREQVKIARVWHELGFQFCHLPIVHLWVKYFSIFTIYLFYSKTCNNNSQLGRNIRRVIELIHVTILYSIHGKFQGRGSVGLVLFSGENSNGEYVFCCFVFCFSFFLFCKTFGYFGVIQTCWIDFYFPTRSINLKLSIQIFDAVQTHQEYTFNYERTANNTLSKEI